MNSSSGGIARSEPGAAAVVGRGALASFLGQILGKGARFVAVNIVLARALGPSGFGRFSLVIAVMQVAQLLGMFGQSTVISRFVSLSVAHGRDDEARGYLWTAFSVGTVGAALTCGVVALGAEGVASFFHDDELVGPLRVVLVSGPAAVVLALVAITLGVLSSPARLVVVRDLMPAVAMVAAALPLAWSANTLLDVAWGTAGGYWLMATLALILQWAAMPAALRGSPRWPSVRALASFSLANALVAAVAFLNLQADRVMLGHFGTQAEVGVYSVAAAVASQLYIVPVSLNTLFAPRAARLIGIQHGLARGLFATVLRWSVAAGVAGVVVVASLAEWLLRLSGPDYLAGATSLVILAVAAGLFGTLGGLAGSMLQVGGRPGGAAFGTALGLVVNLALNVVLIPAWGPVGAAIATAAGALASTFVLLLLCGIQLEMPVSSGVLWAGAAFGGALVAALLARLWLGALGGLVIGSLAWPLAAAAVLRSEDDRELWSRLRQFAGRLIPF